VIKFVSDLRQVSGIHWVLRFPPPTKPTTIDQDITEILLKVVLKQITLKSYANFGPVNFVILCIILVNKHKKVSKTNVKLNYYQFYIESSLYYFILVFMNDFTYNIQSMSFLINTMYIVSLK